jgi:hypothetical protein
VLVIPHFDPGRDKYGSQPESFRRVVVLTWMITVKVVDMLMKESTASDSKGKSRALILQKVLDAYRNEIDLRRELQKTKEELLKVWAESNRPGLLVSAKLREQRSLNATVHFICYIANLSGESLKKWILRRSSQIERKLAANKNVISDATT